MKIVQSLQLDRSQLETLVANEPQVVKHYGEPFGSRLVRCANQQVIEGAKESISAVSLFQMAGQSLADDSVDTLVQLTERACASVTSTSSSTTTTSTQTVLTSSQRELLQYAGNGGLRYGAGKQDLERIIKACTSLNCVNEEGQTALHLAIINKNLSMVKALLKKKANVNIQDAQRKTALHYEAIAHSETIISLLLEKGAYIGLKDQQGRTALHYVSKCQNEHAEAMTKALLVFEQDLDTTDHQGYAPLHYAAKNRRAGVVEQLLRKKADVDIKTPEGWQALHFVAKYGVEEKDKGNTSQYSSAPAIPTILSALNYHNCQLNQKTSDGGLPALTIAKIHRRDYIVRAIEHIMLEAQKRLCSCGGYSLSEDPFLKATRRGIDIDTVYQHSSGRGLGYSGSGTALHCAVGNYSTDRVRFLLERGASVEVRDLAGKTARELNQELAKKAYSPTPPEKAQEIEALFEEHAIKLAEKGSVDTEVSNT